MPKVSIVIPTFNLINELKSCIESIRRNTSDLDQHEVIVVSNGCQDGTVDYVNSLGEPFKVIHWPKAIGYPKATNIGISLSEGDYILLLNNDISILDYGKDNWLSILLRPFEVYPKAGITGVSKMWRGQWPWLVFFCAMIKREVFNKVGLLDEVFSPGAGEDTDFCIKAQMQGFSVHQVPNEQDEWTYQTPFPIYHKSGVTTSKLNFPEFYSRNEKILLEKYGVGSTKIPNI